MQRFWLKESVVESKRWLAHLATIKHSLVQAIEENKKYLLNGVYHIDYNEKIVVYRKRPEVTNFIHQMNAQLQNAPPSIKGSVHHLIRKSAIHLIQPKPLHITNDTSQKRSAELLMMTYDGGVKLFDFEQQLVFYKVARATEFLHRVETHQFFSPYLSLPTVDFIEKDQLMVEKLVAFQPWLEKTKRQSLNALMDQYRQYLASVSTQTASLVGAKHWFVLLRQLNPNHKLIAAADSLFQGKWQEFVFPTVRVHGDFCFKNILHDSDQVYVIDWEKAGDNWFFYDWMYLFLEEFDKGETIFLRHYLDGVYDHHFTESFDLFGVPFVAEEKTRYLVAVLMDMFVQIELPYLLNGHEKEINECMDTYFDRMQKILTVAG